MTYFSLRFMRLLTSLQQILGVPLHLRIRAKAGNKFVILSAKQDFFKELETADKNEAKKRKLLKITGCVIVVIPNEDFMHLFLF